MTLEDIAAHVRRQWPARFVWCVVLRDSGVDVLLSREALPDLATEMRWHRLDAEGRAACHRQGTVCREADDDDADERS